MRDLYSENPQKKIQQTKEYHQQHPEVVKKSYLKYQKNNRVLCRQRCRNWYHENEEEQRARSRTKGKKAYAENGDKIRASNRAWAARNKDKIRQRDLRLKALLKGAKINLDHMSEWMAKVKSHRFSTCYWCDKEVSTSDIHFDHIVPLSKGGEHCVENLCVSCEACNCSKQAKSVTAWVRIGQQTLNL